MNNKNFILVFISFFVIATGIIISISCRWNIVSAGQFAYRLDRWTGKIVFVSPIEIRELNSTQAWKIPEKNTKEEDLSPESDFQSSGLPLPPVKRKSDAQ